MRPVVLCLLALASIVASVWAEEPSRDARLDQRVTYDGGYKRLSTIVEDLARMTGVQIKCGRNVADWQVRDIPMTISVREMPLEQLLCAITDAVHLDLKVAQEGGETTYRLWRGGERGAELSRHLSAVRKLVLDQRAWEWEVLSRLNKVPEDALKSGPGGHVNDENLVSYALHLSRILTALGRSARSRVLAGDVVRITLEDSLRSCHDALLDLFLDAYKRDGEIGGLPRAEERDKRLAQCGLVILREDGRDSNIQVRARLDKWGRSVPLSDRFRDLVDALVQDKTLAAIGIAPRPTMPPVPTQASRNQSLKRVDFEVPLTDPLLNTKVHMARPVRERLAASDVLAALSEASGTSIVCEDFLTHRTSQPSLDDLFKGEMTVAEVLKPLSRIGNPNGRGRFDWYVSDADKLIVGCAGDWPLQHRDLVPESLLSYLRDRLNGDGVDLDEYLLYAYMDPDQREQWVHDSRDLARLTPEGLPYLTYIWRFYASLTQDQKAQARSENGLRLDLMGPRYVNDMLWKDWESRRLYSWLYPDPFIDPEPLVDPRWTLILKVEMADENPPFSLWGPDDIQEEMHQYLRQWAQRPKTHWYTIEVNYEVGSEIGNLVRHGGPQHLPIYSEKREAELRAAQQSQ